MSLWAYADSDIHIMSAAPRLPAYGFTAEMDRERAAQGERSEENIATAGSTVMASK
jgi:hypothetical protein